VDERARDEERTGCGTCGAERPARASLRLAAHALRAEDEPAAPQTGAPRPLHLPRAASGGAGAVAPLAPHAEWGTAKVLAGHPLHLAGTAGDEPAALPLEAAAPAPIPERPPGAHAIIAIARAPEPATTPTTAPEDTASAGVADGEPAATMVEPLPAGAAIAAPRLAPPASVQALTGTPYRTPNAGSEPSSVEDIARASGGSDAAQGLAQSPGSEAARSAPDVETSPVDAREEDAPPTGPGTEDRVAPSAAPAGVADLIPQLRPSSSALSPSVAPALGPVEVELAPMREPDAPRPIEPVAPRPKAVRAGRLPPISPTFHSPTPAEPELMGTPAARAQMVPAPSPASARGLPLPSREGFGVEGRHVRLLLGAGLALLIGVGALLLVLLLLYRWVDPPASTLMLSQRFAGTPTTQRWIPLERISPNLVAAVVASEDGHFCRHHGVDWGELREAIESAGDGLARGGSTISMQLVKNLFLWPSRSYVRKAIEIPLAYAIEVLWSKRRILEIYLNIAEWGPGIFGAEAAARYHFRKPALLLTAREAALLAVSLPNPFERQAGRPGPGTLRLADNLLLRMKAAQANTACVRTPTFGR